MRSQIRLNALARHEQSELGSIRVALMTVVLLGAMFMSALPQFALSVMAPILILELGIGEAILGIIAASLYVVAACTARGAGRLLDSLSGRAAVIVLGVLSVLSLTTISQSTSVRWLMFGAMLGGAGVGLNNPVTNRVISLHIVPGRRGIVIGLKQSGVKVAQITAGTALPALTLTVGWRQGILVLAAVSAALVVLGMWIVPGGGVTHGITPSSAADSVRRQIRWLRSYSIFMAFSVSATTTYIALYAVNRVDMGLAQAGLLVTIFGVTGMVSRIIWAVLAERVDRPPLVLMGLSFGGVIGLSLIAVSENANAAWPIWVGAALTGTTIGTWNVIAQLTVVREVSSLHSATATGSVHAAFAIGLAMGPAAFGAIVEYAESFLLGWLSTAAMCAFGFAVASQELRRRSLDHSRPLGVTASASDEESTKN